MIFMMAAATLEVSNDVYHKFRKSVSENRAEMDSSPMTSWIPEPERREREALAARIRRRYATATTRIEAAGVQIPFTRVADPDVVFDQMAAESHASERDDASVQPYWAKAWDSNLAIAAALEQVDLTGRRVIDLGCGLGLIGAIAAARGAHVWLADAATPALLFARLNTWPWRDRCEILRLDWRRDRIPGVAFDWIIGSDILYDRAEWPYLESLWCEQLAPEGVVVLGEPYRVIGDEFLTWIANRPWTVTVESCAVPGIERRLRRISLRLA